MKMTLKYFCVFILLISLSSCQKNEEIESAKSVIDKFYVLDSKDDYKSIDSLIATRFYQVMPYYKFVGFLKNKKNMLGSYSEKELDSYKVTVTTNSKSTVFLKYKVKYSLKNTNESFMLEKKGNQFKIIKYDIE